MEYKTRNQLEKTGRQQGGSKHNILSLVIPDYRRQPQDATLKLHTGIWFRGHSLQKFLLIKLYVTVQKFKFQKEVHDTFLPRGTDFDGKNFLMIFLLSTPKCLKIIILELYFLPQMLPTSFSCSVKLLINWSFFPQCFSHQT